MRVRRMRDWLLPPPVTRAGRDSSRDCGGGESRDTNRKNFVTHAGDKPERRP
jgi:hypothetical protein